MALSLAKVLKVAQEDRPLINDADALRHATATKNARQIESEVARRYVRTYDAMFFQRKLGNVPLSTAALQGWVKDAGRRFGLDLDVEKIATQPGVGRGVDTWLQIARKIYDYGFDLRTSRLAEVSAGSHEEGLIHVIRADHLWGAQARLIEDQIDAVLAGAGDEAFTRSLIKAAVEDTTEGAEWYARSWTVADKSINTIGLQAFRDWLHDTMELRPERRPLATNPLTMSLDLNAFARELEDEGLWTIGFKARKLTPYGEMVAARDLFVREFDAWDRSGRDLYVEAAAKSRAVDAWLAAHPRARRNAAGIPTAAAYRHLHAEWVAATDAIAAHNAAQPRLPRIGKYAPLTYTLDPAELQLDQMGAIMDDLRVAAPNERGMWHATTSFAKVSTEGLKSRNEMAAEGRINQGLGGAGSQMSSTTYSRVHAEMVAERLTVAARAARGEMTVREVLDYFRPYYELDITDPLSEGAVTRLANALNLAYDVPLPGERIGSHLTTFRHATQAMETPETWNDFVAAMERWIARGYDDHPSFPMSWLTDSNRTAPYVNALGTPERAAEALYNMVSTLDMYAPMVGGYGRGGRAPGRRVVIIGPWEAIRTVDPNDVGIVRVAARRSAPVDERAHEYELAFDPADTFVFEGRPYDAPIEDFTVPGVGGPEYQHVSYARARDGRVYLTPFLDYGASLVDDINLGNRTLWASRFDGVFRAWQNWRVNDFQRGQTLRLVTGRYEGILPEQVDAFIDRVNAIAYERWRPSRYLPGIPLSPQAAAILRERDVAAVARKVFGAGVFRNRVTGVMETPDWPRIIVDGFRQGYHLNLTAALTSKLYTLGTPGALAIMAGQYINPVLRFVLSPVFKGSELVESGGFNLMRGARPVSAAEKLEWARSDVRLQSDQIAAELGNEQMAQGLAAGTPRSGGPLAEAGLASLADIDSPFALVALVDDLAARRATGAGQPWFRQGWDSLKNPTPYKDQKALDLQIKVIRDDFPRLLEKVDPAAYRLFRDELGVPDREMARFLVEDRALYQRWQNGEIDLDELIAHTEKYTSPTPFDVEPDASGLRVPAEAGYAYHVTDHAGFAGIRQTGLQPGSFFVAGESSGYPGNFMLRFPLRQAGHGDLAAGQIRATRGGTIKARSIEYWGADSHWHPIEGYQRPSALEGRVAPPTPPRSPWDEWGGAGDPLVADEAPLFYYNMIDRATLAHFARDGVRSGYFPVWSRTIAHAERERLGDILVRGSDSLTGRRTFSPHPTIPELVVKSTGTSPGSDFEVWTAAQGWQPIERGLFDVPPAPPVRPPTPDALYAALTTSEDWAAAEALFRIAARSAQAEAFGVHYFGSYRSAFERSINHPLLGVYPASWAYKAAREWVRFLYDNRVFGDGALRLGMAPAVAIAQMNRAQSIAWAQSHDTSLEEWAAQGPLGNAMFLFNLLMPGDWSSIPFPLSRSIRETLRGQYNPIELSARTLFGPENRGGLGVIRDANLGIRVGEDIYDAIAGRHDPTAWDRLVGALDAQGNARVPFGWEDLVQYPTTGIKVPVNTPAGRLYP
ncbi:MAG TPA: hypothetical protein VIV06_04715 [Candidatus Limnocylindrales bacterium]